MALAIAIFLVVASVVFLALEAVQRVVVSVCVVVDEAVVVDVDAVVEVVVLSVFVIVFVFVVIAVFVNIVEVFVGDALIAVFFDIVEVFVVVFDVIKVVELIVKSQFV